MYPISKPLNTIICKKIHNSISYTILCQFSALLFWTKKPCVRLVPYFRYNLIYT